MSADKEKIESVRYLSILVFLTYYNALMSQLMALVNFKSRGGLTHPYDFIFKLLSDVEKSFAKHCKDNDVSLLTIDDSFF